MTDQPTPSWFNRNWKWVVPVGCLTPLIMCVGLPLLILSVVFGALKSSDAYTRSLAAVQASPTAREKLGQPIEPGYFLSGRINVNGPNGHADISYPVTGPKGSGTVHAVADKAAGTWTFTTMKLQIDTTGEQIDLMPQEE